MSRKFFITTPIYYVNDVPHIGHAYTTIAADVLARYKRLRGYDVFFLTGTDEHGKKIERAAEATGETPKQLADRVVERYKALWQKLNISYNKFIRTTDDYHIKGVESLWKKIAKKGDLYLGVYEDWYCVPCESYWPDKELVDGKCPQCGRDVERLKEDSYFFRMSKYEKLLLDHIENNPDFIQPEFRRNEILSFVREGLRDLSVSRVSFSWGIPVPENKKHIIYVWFDALANYITAIGYDSNMEEFQKYWPADVHFIGKDILRFHAVYWPTFLLSADLPLPGKIFAHGWWTVDGKKMSKSLGNIVDPLRVAQEFSSDVLRYFLLREVPFGLDGDFSLSALKQRLNSDLADDLGNFVQRIIGISERFLNMKTGKQGSVESSDRVLIDTAERVIKEVDSAMDAVSFQKALVSIWELIGTANKYVADTAPWVLARQKNRERLEAVGYNYFEALRIISHLLYPFMPETVKKIEELVPFELNGSELGWGHLRQDLPVKKGHPLFKKTEETIEVKGEKASERTVKEEERSEGMISIEEFKRIDLRIATVVSAERVSGSEKLLKLIVDTGNNRKQIVAGIGRVYEPSQLVGKQIVIVANLKPAKLMGLVSEGMLLAAGESENLSILIPEKEQKAGTRVK